MAVAMFAVHAARAQAVPINPIYTAREIGHILADSRPEAVSHDGAITAAVQPRAEAAGARSGRDAYGPVRQEARRPRSRRTDARRFTANRDLAFR